MSDDKSSTDSDRVWAQFFKAHPEYFDQVAYRQLPGEKAPQLVVRTPGWRAFIDWADRQGYVRARDKIAPLLRLLAESE